MEQAAGALVTIPSPRGPNQGIYHRAGEGKVAIVCFGGFDGGFDGPADAIFPTLADDLSPFGVSTLRLDYRLKGPTGPGIVEEGAYDVLQGIEYLLGQGVEKVGLVGHSFGAAVMITAGAASPQVAAVVTMSAQTAGAQDVHLLSPRPILLIHGTDDIRLAPELSWYLYQRAGEPKEMVFLEGARHSLRQKREELRTLLREWLVKQLVLASYEPQLKGTIPGG